MTDERATLAAERSATQAARAAEARWRTPVDHQPGLGVAVYDGDLRVVSAGGPAFGLAGLDPETLVGPPARPTAGRSLSGGG